MSIYIIYSDCGALTRIGGVGLGVRGGRRRTAGLFVCGQVVGRRFGRVFHSCRCGGLFVVRTGCTVVAVVPVMAVFGRPFGRAGRRRPPLLQTVRFVRAGRRPRPAAVVMMTVMIAVIVMIVLVFRRFGRRRHRRGLQTVVRRRPAVVVVRARGVVAAVDLRRRVFAATGHLVLQEPAYVRQREHRLTLSARQQVHLIGTDAAAAAAVVGVVCRRVRIRCEQIEKEKKKKRTLHENVMKNNRGRGNCFYRTERVILRTSVSPYNLNSRDATPRVLMMKINNRYAPAYCRTSPSIFFYTSADGGGGSFSPFCFQSYIYIYIMCASTVRKTQCKIVRQKQV